MNDVRISVVVPNYNHAKHLPRCLNALLNQSVRPFEIIVVDDASTDSSVDVINEFARQHPIIHLARNERNLNVVQTIGRGLDMSTGEYVFFPAADDEVRPDIFSHATRLLREYPNAGLCSGVGEFCDTQTGLKWYYGGGMPKQPCYLTPREMLGLAKKGLFHICSYNAVFRRSALIGAGGWIPDLRSACDWFATHVVAFRHGMCHVPEILSTAYVYPDSYSQRPGRFAEGCKVAKSILDLLDSPPYADVAPLIRQSGVLSYHGLPMLQVLTRHRGGWPILTHTFIKQLARRLGETYGRRFLPNRLAQACVRYFYAPALDPANMH